MSKMIPQSVINAHRQALNVVVDANGIDCTLYIPTNMDTVEQLDFYSTPDDVEYDQYAAQVFIEWSPNSKRLRQLNIFVNDEIPILARFSHKATALDGTVRNVDVIVGSYISIEMQAVPNNEEQTSEYDVVDILTGPSHDALVSKVYKIAPRRVKLQ
jgi:hypothetical protein